MNEDDQATSRRVLIQRLSKYSHGLPYRATLEYSDDELRKELIAVILPLFGNDGLREAIRLLSLPDDRLTR